NRAAPGALSMPEGTYHCDLVLTEESFHDFTLDGGNWASVFSAPVDFEIATPGGQNGPYITVNSSTQLTAQIAIDATAALGWHDAFVTNGVPGGGTTTLHQALVLNNPAPVLTSI